MKILLNGERVEDIRLELFLKSEALNFGFSIFETVKVKDSKTVFLKEHIDRLNRSLELLGIDSRADYEELSRSCRDIIDENGFTDGALKILSAKVGENETAEILSLRKAAYAEEVYQRGFKLKLTGIRRNEKSILLKIKSSNYMENLFQKREAVSKGYDDMLFLNTEGGVAETSTANIFFIKAGRIFTPDRESGILSGVVRDVLIAALRKRDCEIEEGSFSLDELMEADEIFVTNSLMGVMPVSSVDGKSFGIERGLELRRLYEELEKEDIENV